METSGTTSWTLSDLYLRRNGSGNYVGTYKGLIRAGIGTEMELSVL